MFTMRSCLGDLWMPLSAAEHQSRSRRPKIRRYAWYLRNFDWSVGCLVISGDAFDLDNVSFLRKTMARVGGNCRCRQSRSLSHNLVDVTRRKIGRYVWYHYWYVWNFYRPLGLSGHLRRCFWHRQWVISSKNDGTSPWQLPLLSAVKHQLLPSPFRHFTEYPQFCIFILPSILHNTISHFA